MSKKIFYAVVWAESTISKVKKFNSYEEADAYCDGFQDGAEDYGAGSVFGAPGEWVDGTWGSWLKDENPDDYQEAIEAIKKHRKKEPETT